ncbi:MAG TPA: RNA polymerase factor sigma-54 [Candidatus Binataceae bacterium]|nr:RNA polymerase factor sigma-54 [Candidatus Binataceae bacterium]
MALEVKLGQDLRLRQQLVMTPQLQQAIKILQLSLPELESIVQSELEQNPMLEPLDQSPAEAAADSTMPEAGEADESGGEPLPAEAGEAEAAVAAADDDWETGAREEKPAAAPEQTEAHDAAAELKELGNLDKVDWREYLETYSNNWQEGGAANSDPDDDHRGALENTSLRRSSLEDHLMWQLRLSNLSEGDQRIGATIIYNLNDDGYLETPIEELAGQLEVPAAEVERVLMRVQRFDPPGAASRDLRECLLAQLKNLGMEDSIAARIVGNHLDLLEKHRYGEIAKLVGVSADMVAQAAKVISGLEPKPGRDYGGAEPSYIVPDVYIQKVGDDYVVTLNREAVPRLRLAGYYQRVLNDPDAAPETREYLQERLRSARWLVKSIYQRQQTIFKVATSIVKFQHAFFEHGVSHLRPLVLKDVAEDIRMHESTISRATANKYAHTPQGIFELKFFFTSGVKGTSGEDVSAETVKEQIRVLVTAEPPGDPLSDQAIAEMLRARQINIARRTVAKYRQALGILPSATRKQAG